MLLFSVFQFKKTLQFVMRNYVYKTMGELKNIGGVFVQKGGVFMQKPSKTGFLGLSFREHYILYEL